MKRRRPPSRVMLNPAAVWRLLDELDMSQNELARRCGITPGHLSLLMNWKRSPSPKLRGRMQRVLGVSNFDDLFIIRPIDHSPQPALVCPHNAKSGNKKGSIHGLAREGTATPPVPSIFVAGPTARADRFGLPPLLRAERPLDRWLGSSAPRKQPSPAAGATSYQER